MSDEARQLFTVDPDDWEKNPALIRETLDGQVHEICLQPGHSGDKQGRIWAPPGS